MHVHIDYRNSFMWDYVFLMKILERYIVTDSTGKISITWLRNIVTGIFKRVMNTRKRTNEYYYTLDGVYHVGKT